MIRIQRAETQEMTPYERNLAYARKYQLTHRKEVADYQKRYAAVRRQRRKQNCGIR